jgi:hypothetical protein
MIHYICRNGEQNTIAPFLCTTGSALQNVIRVTSYEEIFAEGALAAGHLIFTDLDRLSGYELEAAQVVAKAMRDATPGVRILNEPVQVLLRYSLITMLWKEGLNPFRAVRLDGAIPTLRYPVFIRREDGALGPESGLVQSEKELRDVMAELLARGCPLRGRLAVEYCAERSSDGYFRKYGAFRVDARILPQHIQFSRHWVVKQDTGVVTPPLVDEEMDYIRGNPHEGALRAVFDCAKVGFGRIDYSFVGGRLVVYEINTNPMFPSGNHRNGRQHLRRMVGQKLVEALRELDSPLPRADAVRFILPSLVFRALPLLWIKPGSIAQLLGRSALLDRIISLYWRVIPESLRRRLPTGLKMSATHVLDLFFPKRVPLDRRWG